MYLAKHLFVSFISKMHSFSYTVFPKKSQKQLFNVLMLAFIFSIKISKYLVLCGDIESNPGPDTFDFVSRFIEEALRPMPPTWFFSAVGQVGPQVGVKLWGHEKLGVSGRVSQKQLVERSGNKSKIGRQSGWGTIWRTSWKKNSKHTLEASKPAENWKRYVSPKEKVVFHGWSLHTKGAKQIQGATRKTYTMQHEFWYIFLSENWEKLLVFRITRRGHSEAWKLRCSEAKTWWMT